MYWTDERQLPKELEYLFESSETPKELWASIAKARDEIDLYGAVTYPTKANTEKLFMQFIDTPLIFPQKIIQDNNVSEK